MVKKIIIYWRDIPSQVIFQRGRTREKAMLGSRFQEAIDRAAMRAGLPFLWPCSVPLLNYVQGSWSGWSLQIASAMRTVVHLRNLGAGQFHTRIWPASLVIYPSLRIVSFLGS